MSAKKRASAAPIEAAAMDFLLELVDTPGPSGFEDPAAQLWRSYAEPFAQVRTDALGNSFATVNAGGSPKIALVGHLDEIGLIVTKIDDKGFLRCDNIGGWDTAVLVGQRVRVLTPDGPVFGSIGRSAVHTLDADARSKVPKLRDLWIDIGVDSGDDARSKVRIGSPAVVDVAPIRIGDNRLLSRSLDNRLGSFVAIEAARELASRSQTAETTVVGSISEEIGHIGAMGALYGLHADYAIAVDVTTPSCTPGGNDTGDFSVGKGPIITRGATTSRTVVDRLLAIAADKEIPHQVRGMGIRTRTDADAAPAAGEGTPAGLVSVPARYLHTPCEHADLRDVRAAIDLLVAYVESFS